MKPNSLKHTRLRTILIGSLIPYALIVLWGMDPIAALGLLAAGLLITSFSVFFFVRSPPGQDPDGPVLRYTIAEFRRWPWTVPLATRRWCVIAGILTPAAMAVAMAQQGLGWGSALFMLSLAPLPLSITWYFGWFESLTGQNESGAQPLT